MIVLGVHYGHDGSACIVKNGKLVCALSHERTHRQKKAHGISNDLLDRVLVGAGVTVEQIDAIAISDWNCVYSHGTLDVYKDGQPVPDTWNRVFDNEIWQFDGTLRGKTFPVFNVGHHLCHCAAAYYTSPFQDAACFSMDSSGGWLKSNSLVCKGEGNKLTALDCPGAMIGLIYGNFTERLGLGSQMFKAGAMMGLAAYGEVLDRIDIKRYIGESFFPPERDQDYWRWLDVLWQDFSGQTARFENSQHDSKAAMNIAATMQLLFEECILDQAARLPDSDNLCLGGGSFLNCNANTRVMRESKFKNVHLFPAASDDGCAVGAALYVAHHMNNEPRHEYTDAEIAYLGPDQGPENPTDLRRVAQALADGKVVGWFQGKGEFGPRALGNRSILADPRSPTMREHINSNVKNREWFRPLAPSVLAGDCAYWFDFDGESPHMLLTANVKSDEIPAVKHVDGTARMQTVTRAMNPVYYDLISEFAEHTSVPMLLNTSLNGNGEPLVEDEASVRRLWENARLDMMVYKGDIWER